MQTTLDFQEEKEMKRLIALLVLVAMTAACGGGPSPQQLQTLAKAKAQEEGWRPLYTYDSGGYIFIVACLEKSGSGEGEGAVSMLMLDEKPEIVAKDDIKGVTCIQVPPPAEIVAAH